MKENSNKDCVVNVKNVEISDELGKNLIKVTDLSKHQISRRKWEDVRNVVRDSIIPIGLINYGENVCFFNSVI